MRKLPIFVILLAAVAALIAGKVPLDASEAHHRADSVLFPRFVAAANDWWDQHPREAEHLAKFDKKDAERWKLVRESFKDMDQAMKQAGY